MSLPMVGVYLLTLAVTHLFRVSRWAHLLAPIGVQSMLHSAGIHSRLRP